MGLKVLNSLSPLLPWDLKAYLYSDEGVMLSDELIERVKCLKEKIGIITFDVRKIMYLENFAQVYKDGTDI